MFETKYATLEDRQLYRLLRTEKWKGYDEETRLALFQEVENRQAAKLGRRPLEIVTFKAPRGQGGVMGYFNPEEPGKLYLNEKIIKGKPGILHDYSVAAGLNYIIHEGRHAYQYECIEGRITDVDEQTRKEWALNKETYISGLAFPGAIYIYSQQAMERDARLYAERELECISEVIREEMGLVDVGYEKAIYKLRAGEYACNNIAGRMFQTYMLDEIDAMARERYRESHPDEDMDGVSMFSDFRKQIEMQKNKDYLDNPARLDSNLDDFVKLFGKEMEKLREVNGDQALTENRPFREGLGKGAF